MGGCTYSSSSPLSPSAPPQILSRAATVRYDDGKAAGGDAAAAAASAEDGDGAGGAAAGAEGGGAGGLVRHTTKGGLNLSKATFAVEEGDKDLDMKVRGGERGRVQPTQERRPPHAPRRHRRTRASGRRSSARAPPTS